MGATAGTVVGALGRVAFKLGRGVDAPVGRGVVTPLGLPAAAACGRGCAVGAGTWVC